MHISHQYLRVAAHQKLKLCTHSLREDLRIITLRNLPDFILCSSRVHDPVLPLHPILDLLPKLLLNDLVLLQQVLETSLDALRLGLLRAVALGELVQLFDLVLGFFAGSARLIVELRSVRGGLGVGGGLRCMSIRSNGQQCDAPV